MLKIKFKMEYSSWFMAVSYSEKYPSSPALPGEIFDSAPSAHFFGHGGHKKPQWTLNFMIEKNCAGV